MPLFSFISNRLRNALKLLFVRGTLGLINRKQGISTGADLGKMLTDLLQNERRRRKLLGGSVACSPGKFSNFNYLKCPFLAF